MEGPSEIGRAEQRLENYMEAREGLGFVKVIIAE
jgi:hypothetical protein